MTTEADVALACMAAFVDGLVSRGVRHACVSPGSRSTPIALALARDPAIEVHVHLDERASAFFALGLAEATAAPVAIVCTSGTAAANLLPAVVEASMARVPLVVLTADRPPELRGVGANQTIDQLELYGRHVRSFVDAPVPGDEPSVGAWRRRGSETATAASASDPAGPVHVNLPFREPLVPTATATAARPREVRPWTLTEPMSLDETDVEGFVVEVDGIERGLVYAGGLRAGGEAVIALADRLGWPLVAEPHSGARRPGALPAGQLLLAGEGFARRHLPEVVVQVGAAPTSRAALSLVARTSKLVVVDPDCLVADPARHASRRFMSDPRALFAGASERLPVRRDAPWLAEWRRAADRARAAVDELLDGWDTPFEGRIARDLAEAVPGGSTLCVGSSMPIRDLDTFMRPRDGLRVLANRGASGIDGFVSTTLGVAASGATTFALMGDLTLLHDVGSLVWNARRGRDAVMVVLNNGGGTIFSFLEQRELPELERLFTTPHGADLEALVRATGAGHSSVKRAAELVPALRAAASDGGVRVIEVAVDAQSNLERHAEVHRAVAEALA